MRNLAFLHAHPLFGLFNLVTACRKNHTGKCKIITPRNDLVTESRERNHYPRYEIMTEGMEKKKVKKKCGHSEPQM